MAGGQAMHEVINFAEVYNPELNQWEDIAARMLSPRVGLALVSMGNRIYAIGMCMDLGRYAGGFLHARSTGLHYGMS